ncbi:MAG: hypothetical protein Q9173_004718 [Seirophora scorigena]
MERLTYSIRKIADVAQEPTRHQREKAEETAETDTLVQYTIDSAREESDAEEYRPAKDWWLQKTAVRTAAVEFHQAETAQADDAMAEDTSDLSAPGAYDDNEEDGPCFIS